MFFKLKYLFFGLFLLVSVLVLPFQANAATVCAPNQNLKLGSRGAAVLQLQRYLNFDPQTKVASFGAGSPGHETSYFGSATYRAVKLFQQKYAAYILYPIGLKAGTGYYGNLTRQYTMAHCINSQSPNIPVPMPIPISMPMPAPVPVPVYFPPPVPPPTPTPTQPPPTTPFSSISSATFISTDSTIKGTWKGVYGSDGYNLVADQINLPNYATLAINNATTWTWTKSTADARALQKAASGSTDRLAAAWYTGGGPLNFDINITDNGVHQVSFYVVDWDSATRSQRIDVLDMNSNVLSSQIVSGFNGGKWLSWRLGGHVQVRVTSLGGANAVVNGVFFGSASTPASTIIPTAQVNPPPGAGGSGGTLNITTTLSPSGNLTLKYKNSVVVDNVAITPTVFGGGVPIGKTVDVPNNSIVWKYPWGTYALRMVTENQRVTYNVIVTNSSATTKLQGFALNAGGAHMPGAPIPSWIVGSPIQAYTTSGPGVATYNWSAGTASLVTESSQAINSKLAMEHEAPNDTCGECRSIFFSTVNYDENQGRPRFDNPIGPGQSMSYSMSLRFDSPVDDTYARFGRDFPFTINWTDRRPIGRMIVANSASQSYTATNPRGWLNDGSIDVTTPTGLAAFRQRFLSYANSTLAILKATNAQGVIMWDIEGGQYSNLNFVGDPRATDRMAPEMAYKTNGLSLADEFFKVFTNAGIKVGVTLRPQKISFDASGRAISVSFTDEAQEYIDKINYAKSRWGAKIFYIDSTRAYTIGPILQKVYAAEPDVLLIPENQGLSSYAYSAPYDQLDMGAQGTPADVRAVYPNAFGVLEIDSASLAGKESVLAAAVRRGDILMWNSWYHNEAETFIRNAYNSAVSSVDDNSNNNFAAVGILGLSVGIGALLVLLVLIIVILLRAK